MEPVVGGAVVKRKASPPSEGIKDGPDVKKRMNEEETTILENREEWDTLTVTKLANKVKIRLSSDSRLDRLWTESYDEAAAILSRICRSVRVGSVMVKLDLSVSGQSKCLSVLPLVECTNEVTIYHQCMPKTSTVETLPAAFLASLSFFPGAKKLSLFRVFLGFADFNLFYELIKRSSFDRVAMELPSPVNGLGLLERRDAMGIVEKNGQRTTSLPNAEVFFPRDLRYSPKDDQYYDEIEYVMCEGGWTTRIRRNQIDITHLIYRGTLAQIPYLASSQ